jgi:hypothetical protein
MNPEPLPPPSKIPKSGVTKVPVETIWMVAIGRSSTDVMRPSGAVVVVTTGVVVGSVVEGVSPLWQAINTVARNVNFSLCFTVLP